VHVLEEVIPEQCCTGVLVLHPPAYHAQPLTPVPTHVSLFADIAVVAQVSAHVEQVLKSKIGVPAAQLAPQVLDSREQVAETFVFILPMR